MLVQGYLLEREPVFEDNSIGTMKRYLRQNVKYTLQIETLNMLRGLNRILRQSNHVKKMENV
jgi:hypothetical protein